MKPEQRFDRDAVSVADQKQHVETLREHLKRPHKASEFGTSSGTQTSIRKHILGEQRDPAKMSQIERHVFGIERDPASMSAVERHIYGVELEKPEAKMSNIRKHIFGAADE